jgi:hypothetical protein
MLMAVLFIFTEIKRNSNSKVGILEDFRLVVKETLILNF